VGRPGECLEPLGRNRSSAALARAECPGVDSLEGCVDQLELLDRPVAEGEVALLLEHLAGRRGLGPVRHRLWRRDRFGHLAIEARPFGEQSDAGCFEVEGGHGRIVRPVAREAKRGRQPYPRAQFTLEDRMAIEIDPVCGMEVDTTTSELKTEHNGRTFWFCGRGCLLEFRDDPDKYLDPSYQPSM
jgi:YHS domain-containing protein